VGGLIGDGFGGSVAISGNTIVIGAAGHDSQAGRAYVFTKGPTGWRQVAELKGNKTKAGWRLLWGLCCHLWGHDRGRCAAK